MNGSRREKVGIGKDSKRYQKANTKIGLIFIKKRLDGVPCYPLS